MKNEVEDKVNQKANQKVYHSTKSMLMIRVLVGGFVLYLAYSILNSLNDSVGNDKYVMIAFSGLFIVAGLVIAGSSLWAIYKKQYAEAMENGNVEDVLVNQDEKDSDLVDLFSKKEMDVKAETVETAETAETAETFETAETVEIEVQEELESEKK